jgi:hypothetical protein
MISKRHPRKKNFTTEYTEFTEKEEENKLKLRAVPQDSLPPCPPWFIILIRKRCVRLGGRVA